MGSLPDFERNAVFDPQATAMKAFGEIDAQYPNTTTIEDALAVVGKFEGATVTNFIGVLAKRDLRTIAEQRIRGAAPEVAEVIAEEAQVLEAGSPLLLLPQ